MKESDAVQSLGKTDKIEFLIEPKQTELAKHRSCGANIMQVYQHDDCLSLIDMTYLLDNSQRVLL